MSEVAAFSRPLKRSSQAPLRDLIDAMSHARCTEKQMLAAEGYLMSLGYRVPARHEPTAKIYVIGPQDGPFKIGISSDPQGRLKGFQIASARKLQLHHHSKSISRKNANQVERAAHKKLKEYALSGEWFSCPKDLAIGVVDACMGPFHDVGDVI